MSEVFQNIKRFQRVPDLSTNLKFGGNIISGSLEIANAFNQHFASVFKEDTSRLLLPPVSTDTTICLEDMYFYQKGSKVDDSKVDDYVLFGY